MARSARTTLFWQRFRHGVVTRLLSDDGRNLVTGADEQDVGALARCAGIERSSEVFWEWSDVDAGSQAIVLKQARAADDARAPRVALRVWQRLGSGSLAWSPLVDDRLLGRHELADLPAAPQQSAHEIDEGWIELHGLQPALGKVRDEHE